jgi:hypothetical protein
VACAWRPSEFRRKKFEKWIGKGKIRARSVQTNEGAGEMSDAADSPAQQDTFAH